MVEIAFNGWTRDNQIRQGHYLGQRADKPAEEVVRALMRRPIRAEAE